MVTKENQEKRGILFFFLLSLHCMSQLLFLPQTVTVCRELLSLQMFSEKIAAEANL